MDNINERWMPCPHYEDKYQISTRGRVQNIKSGRYLSPVLLNGYYIVCLTNQYGKQRNEYIHRLVALAFIPNPNNYPCVNHKNEIRSDNTLANLEWCDYKYNNNYGTKKTRCRKTAGKTVVQMDTNGNIVAKYASSNEAKEALGKHDGSYIREACRENKMAYGYYWKYEV